MLKKNITRSLYLGVFATIFIGIISCEKDFTDIGSSVVTNTKFSTNDTILEVVVDGKPIDRVRADGFSLSSGTLGQYLLGVYNNSNYEKIEASIISQLGIPSDLTIVDRTYGADTTVVTSIDTVMIRIPYQSTLTETTGAGPQFRLDSIIGDRSKPFTLNVFRSETFLNTLDPTDPTKGRIYNSDEAYNISPDKLNAIEDTQFIPNETDTVLYVKRRLSTGDLYTTDTIKYANAVPFIGIPLKEQLIKQLFFDRYLTSDFASQQAFNNYFRGIKIQAEGNEGSLIGLNLANNNLRPTIDIYYTNTVLIEGGTKVFDTIKKSDTFRLQGIINSSYQMTSNGSPAANQLAVQGTAGTLGQISLFGNGNNTGISSQLAELRSKNWLVNDASLTLYVDQNVVGFDTIATPFRLFIYKNELDNSGNPVNTGQVLDFLSEGDTFVGGNLNLDSNRKPDSYTFKITDYISELLSGDLDYSPPLGVKVFSPTDLPVNVGDTIVRNLNWNPKAVMLLNHMLINGDRRAQLKISYSKSKENN